MADDLIAGLETFAAVLEGARSTRDAALVRAAIRALRTQGEPVAWMCERCGEIDTLDGVDACEHLEGTTLCGGKLRALVYRTEPSK